MERAGWERERYERDRSRMVEEQLARRGISDPRVLQAMGRVPRHLFVEKRSATGPTATIRCRSASNRRSRSRTSSRS